MKLKLITAAALLAVSSSVALADMSTETGSIKIIGGISKLMKTKLYSDLSAKTQPKQSPVFGIEYGFKPAENFRAGLELGYRRNMKIKTSSTYDNVAFNANGKAESMNVMANFYYDIGEFGAFKPYLGAGIGYVRNKLKHLDEKHNIAGVETTFQRKGKATNDFAWQLMAGGNIDLNDSLDLDLSYRFANIGKLGAKTADGSRHTVKSAKRLQAHEFLAGFKFNI